MGWKDKGRYVRKGEKAIVLCMPVTCKRKPADQPQPANSAQPDADSESLSAALVRLEPDRRPIVEPPPMPDWNQTRALEALGIVEEPFTSTDGNCLGLRTTAHDRRVADRRTAAQDAVS
jgi:hypothetical protein